MNMRKQRRSSGFTMIELMLVIVIIAILAGMVTVGTQYARNKSRESATKQRIEVLQLTLEQYYQENGQFPQHVGNDPVENSRMLYTALSGDTSGNGQPDEGNRVYLQELLGSDVDPRSHTWVDATKGTPFIIDSFGNPFNYRSPGVENVQYDLWSYGLNWRERETDANPEAWVKNW